MKDDSAWTDGNSPQNTLAGGNLGSVGTAMDENQFGKKKRVRPARRFIDTETLGIFTGKPDPVIPKDPPKLSTAARLTLEHLASRDRMKLADIYATPPAGLALNQTQAALNELRLRGYITRTLAGAGENPRLEDTPFTVTQTGWLYIISLNDKEER